MSESAPSHDLPAQRASRWRLALVITIMHGLFGMACIALLVASLFLTLIGTPKVRRAKHLRAMAHSLARAWVRIAATIGAMQREIEGDIQPKCALYVANHPTLIDFIHVLADIPDMICVIKAELRSIAMMRWLSEHLGYVHNADPAALLDTAATTLAAGQALLIFPESTRTIPGEAPEFRMAAAEIARRAAVPIMPVVIHFNSGYLSKASRWNDFPEQPLHYRLAYGPEIVVDPEDPTELPPRAHRRAINEALLAHFHARL